jgi:ribonuclease E
VESLALSVLRLIEEEAMKERTGRIVAQLPVPVATFLLNEKRGVITALEQRNGVHITLVPNPDFDTPLYEIKRIRDDQLTAPGNAEVSYKIPSELEAEIVDSFLPATGRPVQTEEPAVKRITPATPAPQLPKPEPQAQSQSQPAAQVSFWGRVKTLFAPAAAPAGAEPEIARPPRTDAFRDSGRRPESRGPRQDSPGRRGEQRQGRDGGRGYRRDQDRGRGQGRGDGQRQEPSRQQQRQRDDQRPAQPAQTQHPQQPQPVPPAAALPGSDGQEQRSGRRGRRRRGRRGRGGGAETGQTQQPASANPNQIAAPPTDTGVAPAPLPAALPAPLPATLPASAGSQGVAVPEPRPVPPPAPLPEATPAREETRQAVVPSPAEDVARGDNI